jgi:hypothetical protein
MDLTINKPIFSKRLLSTSRRRRSSLIESIRYPFFVHPEKKAVLPKNLEEFLRSKNNIYVGDIHSNELTLWQILSACGLVEIPNERELLKEIYKLRSSINPKNPFSFVDPGSSKGTYNRLVELIQSMKWIDPNRKLYLLGDEICDRGGVIDPLVMLTVLKFSDNIVPHLSNHGIAAFIRIYYPDLAEKYRRATPHKADNTIASMLRTQELFEPKYYLPIYKQYFELWKVLSFDKENALVFSHAPLDTPILRELRGLTGSICELPDTLNCWEYFVDHANNLWINYAKAPIISASEIIDFYTNLSSVNGLTSRNHLSGEPLCPIIGLTNVHGHTNRQFTKVLPLNGYLSLDQRVGTSQPHNQHCTQELIMYLYAI